jgi:hypothetical protein
VPAHVHYDILTGDANSFPEMESTVSESALLGDKGVSSSGFGINLGYKGRAHFRTTHKFAYVLVLV